MTLAPEAPNVLSIEDRISSDRFPEQEEQLNLQPKDKDMILAKVLEHLEDYIRFYDQITSYAEPGWPTFSQSMRMKALIKNKRIIVADDTGVNGKTFTAVGSKILLDKTHGFNHPTLVIAPNAGMLNAWSPEEIDNYRLKLKARPQKVVTVSEYSDLSKVSAETDFLIVNWEKLSVNNDDKRWSKLEEVITSFKPEFYVLDECHNAKGMSSLRGKTIRRLSSYTMGKHLMLASATPIPNRYKDLAVIFHLLDPVKFPDPAMFSYSGPDIMKEFLQRVSWFRLTKEDLKEELGLPELIYKEVPVIMSDSEAEIYFNAWADCVTLGKGLTELRKILYNPALSFYSSGYADLSSSKYAKLRELVEEINARGEKVIIKTNLVNNGVLEDILNLFPGEKIPVVYGDTEPHKRKENYLRFRNQPSCNKILLSQVAEESIDLTTGRVPVTIIEIEPSMTIREEVQLIGRAYRRGQLADVTYIKLVSESPQLNQMMLSFVKEIAQTYGLKVPRSYRPGTIDQNKVAMVKAKKEVARKFYSFEKITKKDQEIHDTDIQNALSHLEAFSISSAVREISPFELASLIQTRWRNIGEEKFTSLVDFEGWERWTQLYEKGWQGSASQASLELITEQLKDIKQILKVRKLYVADQGAGALYLPRAMYQANEELAKNIEFTCIDLDSKSLVKGLRKCEIMGMNPENLATMKFPITKTDLDSHIYDAIVNSYALMYLTGKDIEECAIETNRLLADPKRMRSFWILALPYSIDIPVMKRFTENLEPYGFSLFKELNPEDTKQEHMTSGCFIRVYEKTKNSNKEHGLDLSLYEGRVRLIV